MKQFLERRQFLERGLVITMEEITFATLLGSDYTQRIHGFKPEVFNYKIAVRPDRCRSLENELAAGMEIALNVLATCLNINGLSEQVLEAFASWLQLRHRIPASALVTHPLVLTALLR